MQDLEQTIHMVLDFIRGIWIKKRYLMVCSWLICPLGFFYVSTLPNVYESDARVFVDTRSVLRPLLGNMVMGSNPDEELRMMATTLKSRDNIEKIAREADLDVTAIGDEAYNQLINDLTEDIKLNSARGSNEYTISYQNEDREMARTVVQETLDLFVEGALGNTRSDSETTARFLDDQIADYESQLAESEQRLADFKRQYSDILPLQGTFYANLQDMRTQLETTRLTMKETAQQIEAMKAQTRKAKKASDGLGVRNENEQVLRTRYDDRILALEERLDSLRLRFTDQHPDVIESSNLLEALKEVRDKEIAAYKSQDTGEDNSLMSESDRQLRLEITRLEGQMASLKVRENDALQKIASLQSKIDLVPQVEAEGTALNRDYDIKKEKYEEFLSRREAARVTERADRASDDLQFEILRPPMVPERPSGPKRILFYTGILIVGFGVGIGLAFLMSMLTPVLVRGQQLADLTGFPIWGTVSHLELIRIKRRNKLRVAVFALSSGSIFAIYAGFVMLDILNVDLMSRLPI
ncbi:chain-length determining protein [Glaciecola sp. MH2013]|uniref:XrtA system polysaccharide chain length determinant n=1 Tax=Glaciecola sp. MH2013 TaxID=2785524 RepID=UPI0018A0D492|nr:XrtA system polysaccharide chain length determinant [Glaciecola sp. MH2013]MBF7072148.1 chain-length determining protein [Glaciecola sp. MH2013]